MLDRNDATYISFISNDNALIVDFLTSAAGVLSERGIISSKDVDNLRLVISSVQYQESGHVQGRESGDKSSILLALKAQNADFIEVMNCLFGEFGFGINLLRHTVRSYLTALSGAVCSFGHDLLQKSQSLFNRSFLIYANDACHYQVLFSSALVDLAQVFSDSARAIQVIQDRCGAMVATGLESKPAKDLAGLDQSLTQALGFQMSSRMCLPLTSERSILFEISAVLVEIADACEVFLNSLRKNVRKPVSPQLDFLCEELRLEAGKLRETRFFRGNDLSTWEVRRLSIALALAKFTDLIKIFQSSLVPAIAIEASTIGPSADDLHRCIALRLIASGVVAREAKTAAMRLTAYCELHSISPDQLLVAELAKIDKSLNEESLEILKKYHGDTSLNLSSSVEKGHNMIKSAAMMKSFLTGIGPTGSLAVILLVGASTLLSCGFKTNPKSEVIDVRTELPFRLSNSIEIPKSPAQPPEGAKP